MTILVTGANGFVGRALVSCLSAAGNAVIPCVRTSFQANVFPKHECLVIDDITASTDWKDELDGVRIIIHAAARVHLMEDNSTDPLEEYRRVNVGGTLSLASQAAAAGVKRFIFLSSIKVNGEETQPGVPFTADDLPSPTDPYAISKLEAEQGLMRIASMTSMEVTIIRPVLVYGPGVRANFAALIGFLQRGFILPFGAIQNGRSLVGLDNLVNLVLVCLTHPRAANQVFLVSDGNDISTTELLRQIGKALGKPARLIPVPSWLLKLLARVLGKEREAQRLLSSLQVDIQKTKELLNWEPPISLGVGLQKTVGQIA